MLYIKRILLVASHVRTDRTWVNIEVVKSPWIPMPDKLLNQTAKPIVRKSSEWACFFVIVYRPGTCRMCAQRGVDSEMENSEGEEQTERGRERGGGREGEKRHREWSEEVGSAEVHGEKGRIEGERRNTWFYLQKQSLRGTNTRADTSRSSRLRGQKRNKDSIAFRSHP